MYIARLLFSTVIVAFQARVGHGTPVPGRLQPRVDCDDVSKYTVQYFMDHKVYEPPASTCLFYTAWLSAIAQRFAHSGGASMTTIWDMWPCDYYNGDLGDENNRLRCIFKDKDTRTEYFEHMSEAMAISCDIFATVMTNFTDNIPQDGIWGRVEQPALQRTGNPGGQIDTIVAVDLKGDNLVTVWERPGTRRKRSVQEGNMLEARDQPNGCYTPEQIQEWFGDVPW